MTDISEVLARLDRQVEAEEERCLCLVDTNHSCRIDHAFWNDLRALLDAYADAKQEVRCVRINDDMLIRSNDDYEKRLIDAVADCDYWFDRASCWRAVAKARRKQVQRLRKATLEQQLAAVTHERDRARELLASTEAQVCSLIAAREAKSHE